MSFVRLAPEQFDTIPDVPEPAENPVLFGHEDAGAQLAEAYRTGKLHHALLFAGPPGIGKATLAFHLAHHLLANSDSRAAPPHLAQRDAGSPLHRLIAQDAHPSLLHLTRPFNERTKSFKSVVTVDEIRKVGRFLSMTAHDGGSRVVIVDPADDMNTNAANALLKSLEEPPPRTLFVLIAHQIGSLLPTIRSRCQVIKLKPLDSAALLGVLQTMPVALPETQAGQDTLVKRAGGSVREALLLTQFGGLEIAAAMTGVIEAPSFDVAEARRIAEAAAGKSQEVAFQIFNSELLSAAAGRARAEAEKGDIEAAARWSALWGELGRAVAETETYNLDRKQHVMSALRRMHESHAGA